MNIHARKRFCRTRISALSGYPQVSETDSAVDVQRKPPVDDELCPANKGISHPFPTELFLFFLIIAAIARFTVEAINGVGMNICNIIVKLQTAIRRLDRSVHYSPLPVIV